MGNSAILIIIAAEGLSQPLAADTFRITSSFGEYRHLHFHAGFDYSTGGRSGVPVLALDDGVLFRASFSPWGYGKSLWLMTKGGLIVRYVHLDRFTPRTDSLVYLFRKENRADTGTIEMGVKVKKGQVIAYSGETGAGPPHLHLEIYDSAGRLVNPWDLGFRYPDTVSPTIRGISAVPIDGLVEGLPFESFYPASGNLVPETIRVSGRFGLMLWAQDKWAGEVGVRGVKLTIGDSLVFFLDFSEIDPADNAWADALYAFQGGMNSASPIRCWFLNPKEELRAARALPYIDLPEGVYQGKAEAWDCAGNRAFVKFVVKVGPYPPSYKPPLSWDIKDRGFSLRAFGYGTLILSRLRLNGIQPILETDSGYLYWINRDTSIDVARLQVITKTMGPDGGEVSAFGWGIRAPAAALACSTQWVFYRDSQNIAVLPKYPPTSARCTLFLREADSLGIYITDQDGKTLRYLGKATGAPAGRFGFLRGARDTEPPEIKKITESPGVFEFKLKDEGTGIQEVSLLVDGEWVPGDYDPEEGKYSYRPLMPLLPGDHPWRITARDSQGNETSLEGVVRVK